MKIKFEKIYSQSLAPTRANEGDAGYDLYSAERTHISPMERKIISTGIRVEIPNGYYGRIAPRSGLAIKKGIDVLAGVIDSGYRSEVGVVLINFNMPELTSGKRNQAILNMFGPRNNFVISPGDRIAQLIIEKCHDVEWEESEGLGRSERGESGFGSTGV